MTTNESRKRDAAATRELILDAARQVFADKGFDGAGVREIAARSGVNAALVNRYFGSKEGLFREAVLPEVNLDDLMQGDPNSFGRRVADYFATKTHDCGEFDPTAAALRSISSDAVHDMLRDTVDREIIGKLSHWLGGEDAEVRAVLITAHLLGFDMLRRIVGVKALSPAEAEKACERFAAALQFYVDDDETI